MNNCQVIQDLIPFVNAKVASEESRALVYKHSETCSECRKLLNTQYKENEYVNARRSLKSIKKHFIYFRAFFPGIGITIALILSHVMCSHIALSYSDIRWGIKYEGYSAPAYVAFFLSIPYLIAIIVTLTITFVYWKKRGVNNKRTSYRFVD
ncbi:zf-HC2 domain-containing protein [Amphibacillus sp. Q70]|uniref:zf-HC2 domain-containing protein n=1 Tax=Amphibacillus sp. Q70 TaxID=3453416 RepID=UPI003F85AB5B